MDCSICFEKNDKHHFCSNLCGKVVCKSCMPMLVDFSMRENIVPMCPGQNCSGEFFPQSNPEYQRICYEKLKQKAKGSINEINLKKSLIEKIIAGRVETLKEFPKSIQIVSEIAFPGKLKNISRDNLKRIDKICKGSVIKCLTMFCQGNLNSNYECILCNTKYCEKCETIKGKNHVCKKEDLESVAAMKKIIKCPECKVPVDKIDGCNDITCAVCKTNFCYRTGERIAHGNHDNLRIDLKSSFLDHMAMRYGQEPEIMHILKQIQKKSPEPIENVLVHFLTQNPQFSRQIGEQVARLYKKSIIFCKKSENYIRILTFLKNTEKKLNAIKLMEIYEKL